MSRLFTSESVTEGHPDKVADAISDAVLDELIGKDKKSRVAVETLVTTGTVVVAGEVTTKAYADIAKLARKRIKRIGYDSSEKSFDYRSCGVLVSIGTQSADIAQGVNHAEEERAEGSEDALDAQGAGDQGLMFGYACTETPTLMPLPIDIAHRMAERLAEVRKDGEVDFLLPDGKTQVTVEYDGVRPVRVDTVVVSTQHVEAVSHETISFEVRRRVIEPVLARYDIGSTDLKVHVNPTGKFVIGGPMGDAGVTGRKIIVDTYGGWGRHGGGAFSGKDATKVDRSAAYMGRYVAKNIVAAGLAERCEVQLAYAIGVTEPVSVHIETFGTGKISEDRISELVRENFPLSPGGIIDFLDLRRPIFRATAAGGHFGRDEFPWEATDKAETLAKQAGIAVTA